MDSCSRFKNCTCCCSHLQFERIQAEIFSEFDDDEVQVVCCFKFFCSHLVITMRQLLYFSLLGGIG